MLSGHKSLMTDEAYQQMNIKHTEWSVPAGYKWEIQEYLEAKDYNLGWDRKSNETWKDYIIHLTCIIW